MTQDLLRPERLFCMSVSATKACLFAASLLAACSLSAGEQPALLTLPVRVHLMQSASLPAMHTTLTEADVQRIVTKINKVWSQAGIQFAIESIGTTTAQAPSQEKRIAGEFEQVHSMIPKERLSPAAIDICYVHQVRPNGFYAGEPVVVKDTASLKEVPGGLDEPLPRVTSHELGHALGLPHRQNLTNLMASGTTGFSLNEAEIAIAREKALAWLEKFAAAGSGTAKDS